MADSTTPQTQSKRLIYPRELDNPDIHPAVIRFGFFDRDTPYRSNAEDEILLYMPESSQQPSTVSWDNEKFGFVGATIADVARGAGGRGNLTPDHLGGIVSDAVSRASSSALAMLGSSLANLLGGNVSAEGLMGEVTGKIPNPYLTMVFKGVDFRSFSYVFRFSPTSASDCERIMDIIKTFRRNALPTNEGSLLKYPKECEIQYWWRGSENKYLHKFKRAVCTAIDVDYTPNGMFSTMNNGFPTCIVLSTKWTEVEIVTRDDIDEGF